MSGSESQWSLVCHLDYGDHGEVSIIRSDGEKVCINKITTCENDREHQPVYLGVDKQNQVIIMDPLSKEVSKQQDYPVNAFAAYAYPEASHRLWYVNDGDKETGNDQLNCGDKGSSVTIVGSVSSDNEIKVLKTLCVGRGHHMTAFTYATEEFPDIQKRAYVSNLLDGTISVIGNNAEDTDSYLQVLDTINLCEPDKEKSKDTIQPNNAFPHGKVFSTLTGKVYCLNNGYGTVAVIDPVTNQIESRVDMPVSSNLLLSPDGRFIIGKGADRKSDPDHVMGRISIMDATTNELVGTRDLKDIYPSTYRFNTDGSRLYVTTAATGKGTQREDIKKDIVLVYDTTQLPEIKLESEIQVGMADCGRRPIAFHTKDGKAQTIFVPNPTDGTLTILDASDHRIIDTVELGQAPIKEVNFSLWGLSDVYGC